MAVSLVRSHGDTMAGMLAVFVSPCLGVDVHGAAVVTPSWVLPVLLVGGNARSTSTAGQLNPFLLSRCRV